MIFERAVQREFTQSAAGISIALIAVLTSSQLIRLLNDAAGGRIAPEAVLSLLGFASLNYLPVLLSLTLFISVLLTLSRMYRDSEMVVWLSCGQPLTAWIRPVLKYALPIVLAIAVLSGFLSPWANFNTAQYKQQLAARSDVSQIAPGAFHEVKRGQRVVFVESIADDATKVGNVFSASMQDGKLGVVVSDKGYQETLPNGDQFLVLEKGKRYEVEPGKPEFKIMEFDRYKIRTQDNVAEPTERVPSRLPINELLSENSNQARSELLWRIGMPASAIILALMAIPLSYINPRAGRSINMLIAILIYVIYNNMLSVSQAWVAQGKISFVLGLCTPHALMLIPLVWLYYKRMAVSMPWQRR